MNLLPETENEWLETDGLGAFASGTSSGVRTRRYHNVLMIAKNPPSERVILVNGFDVWLKPRMVRFPFQLRPIPITFSGQKDSCSDALSSARIGQLGSTTVVNHCRSSKSCSCPIVYKEPPFGGESSDPRQA